MADRRTGVYLRSVERESKDKTKGQGRGQQCSPHLVSFEVFRAVAVDAGGEHVVGDGGETALTLRSCACAHILRAVAVVDAGDGVAGGLPEAGELLIKVLAFGGGVVLLAVGATAQPGGHRSVRIVEAGIVGPVDDAHGSPQTVGGLRSVFSLRVVATGLARPAAYQPGISIHVGGRIEPGVSITAQLPEIANRKLRRVGDHAALLDIAEHGAGEHFHVIQITAGAVPGQGIGGRAGAGAERLRAHGAFAVEILVHEVEKRSGAAGGGFDAGSGVAVSSLPIRIPGEVNHLKTLLQIGAGKIRILIGALAAAADQEYDGSSYAPAGILNPIDKADGRGVGAVFHLAAEAGHAPVVAHRAGLQPSNGSRIDRAERQRRFLRVHWKRAQQQRGENRTHRGKQRIY